MATTFRSSIMKDKRLAPREGCCHLKARIRLPLLRKNPVTLGKTPFRTLSLPLGHTPSIVVRDGSPSTSRDFLTGNPAVFLRNITVLRISSVVSGAMWVPVRGPQAFF